MNCRGVVGVIVHSHPPFQPSALPPRTCTHAAYAPTHPRTHPAYAHTHRRLLYQASIVSICQHSFLSMHRALCIALACLKATSTYGSLLHAPRQCWPMWKP